MNTYKHHSHHLVIYIHGKGGSASESEHYVPLFPNCDVTGFDYKAEAPWQAAAEFPAFYDTVSQDYDGVYLIANSIGAYFSLCSLVGKEIKKAYFISPIVDMERLIGDMIMWSGVSENELREKREILTPFGETLSWEYLSWVREHPILWTIPTEILYGEKDNMQSNETMNAFAEKSGAFVTVMPGGEHWFHTDEQMRFLDDWLKNKTTGNINMKEISGFINAEGKLTSLPSKKKKKILALVWLADQIPADREYSEKEFSDLLRTLHTFGDPATLRREMYDYFLIDRDPDGQRYRLNPERPDAEALITQYCGR